MDLWVTYEKLGMFWRKKKLWEWGDACACYVVLNQHISLSASHMYYPFQSVPNALSSGPSVPVVILNQATAH